MDNVISTLRQEVWMQVFLRDISNWADIIQNLKAGEVYDQKYIVFYTETFNLWARRLLFDDKNNNS